MYRVYRFCVYVLKITVPQGFFLLVGSTQHALSPQKRGI